MRIRMPGPGGTAASTTIRIVVASTMVVLLGGCERLYRDMYDQPKYKPLAASRFWPDDRASRPAVAGTVATSAGVYAGASSGRRGAVGDAVDVAPERPLVPEPPSLALLERGRNRFDIYCAPCHSVVGDGDGMIARRGFPHPPSFHNDALRGADDAHFYAVITDGYGVMASYADRLAPADRIAVIAYIRALQLSRHAPAAVLPAEVRARLPQTR